MLNGDFTSPSYFYNITGCTEYDNFLHTNEPADYAYYGEFLNQASVRNAIHVGSLPFNDGKACETHLIPDVMRSLKPELAVLMNHYKVLVYSGQLDVIIAPPLTELYLPTIPWNGQALWANAQRKIWKVNPTDEEVAGFVQSVGQFTYAIVRAAGHILPYDQPERGYDLISRFVNGTPF
jgi:vitellogenic carboxypeptidase-like protein